jgi:hypothetical protein
VDIKGNRLNPVVHVPVQTTVTKTPAKRTQVVKADHAFATVLFCNLPPLHLIPISVLPYFYQVMFF